MTEVAPEVTESVQQLAENWRVILAERNSADLREVPGMSIRWADSKFPFWNCITLNDRGADGLLLKERLSQAVG